MISKGTRKQRVGAVGFALSLLLASRVQSALIWMEDFSGFTEGSDRLALVESWDSDTVGYGSHGIVSAVLPDGGLSGYLGLKPPPDDVVGLWRPVDVPTSRLEGGIVEFSAVVAVVDSTNGRWDNFFVTFGNDEGEGLAAVNFDNTNLLVFVDDGVTVTNTEFRFVPDSYYDLWARINLLENRWTVELDETRIVDDAPFHSGDRAVGLGQIGFEWWVTNLNRPGDNFLVFDSLRIEAPLGLVDIAPSSLDIAVENDGSILVSWEGDASTQYTLERSVDLISWEPLGEAGLSVPSESGERFEYREGLIDSSDGAYYRVRMPEL